MTIYVAPPVSTFKQDLDLKLLALSKAKDEADRAAHAVLLDAFGAKWLIPGQGGTSVRVSIEAADAEYELEVELDHEIGQWIAKVDRARESAPGDTLPYLFSDSDADPAAAVREVLSQLSRAGHPRAARAFVALMFDVL